MIKIGNKDIHNFLICNDIQHNYSERVKKYPPLTPKQFFLLFLTFEKYIKEEENVNRLKMLVEIKEEHLGHAQTIFSHATLPEYTNDDFWNLLFGPYRSEETFFRVGENISKETYDDNRTLFEILYLFNFLYSYSPKRYLENKENGEAILWREVLDDIHCYMEEKAFRFRLEQEVDLRLGRSPICYNLFYFITEKNTVGGDWCFNNLKNMSAAKVKDYFLPDYIEFPHQFDKDAPFLDTQEKSAELNMIIWEKAKKIKEGNPGFILLNKALNQEFRYFTDAVEKGFISRLRKYTAKKRMPPNGASFTEVPDDLEDVDGVIEICEDTRPNTHKKSPLEKHRKLLITKFGETGVKILEFMFKNDLTKKTQEEIAKALNCTDRTLRTYRKKFKENKKLLLEIFDFD